MVRVDGSGRVTLRNRKFLRQYVPVVPRAPLLMAPGAITPPPPAPLPAPGQKPAKFLQVSTPAPPTTPAMHVPEARQPSPAKPMGGPRPAEDIMPSIRPAVDLPAPPAVSPPQQPDAPPPNFLVQNLYFRSLIHIILVLYQTNLQFCTLSSYKELMN